MITKALDKPTLRQSAQSVSRLAVGLNRVDLLDILVCLPSKWTRIIEGLNFGSAVELRR